jgi:formylglycine-generating enzyme required for sulfatase activity
MITPQNRCVYSDLPKNEVYAPSGSFTSDDNTISEDPNLPGPVTVSNAYWIAETEVTYQLWAAVYTWATTGSGATGAGQYHFQNAGVMGDGTGDTDQHPVTTVSWRDAMVWCNALTEYYNAQNGTSLACVYTYSGAIVRDSRDSNTTACDNATTVSTAKGFRLPTSNEWELAARYKDGSTWTPGNYASGATAAYTDVAATQAVAWYWDNSGSSTHPVGEKTANALNIKDMSGNVWEWCFDWYPGYSGSNRVLRGGGWSYGAYDLQLGIVYGVSPGYASSLLGFRPVRTQ